MKTTILTTAILLATVFGMSQSTFARANANREVSTVLNEATGISKIEVHGNVELYVSDGATDQVKVYNSYYSENALVQDKDGVLRISSYQAQKLVVWVTASDLRNLAVYDNAEVKSFGKISSIDLTVELFNNAAARLNMDTFTAKITLNDHAKADLTGDITNATVNYDKSAYLNATNLMAENLTKTENSSVVNNNELSELVSL